MDPFIAKIQERRVNEYSLVSKLGEGGFGTVWIGQDFSTGRQVAIKLQRDELSHDNEFEAYQPVQGIPGFPEVYGSSSIDGYYALILELLGPSLEDLFEFCDRKFSLKTTLLIADQFLDRLGTLHSLGYIHRDLKPENALLGLGDKGNLIHITDFGVTKTFLPGEGGKRMPTSLRPIGAPRYASINSIYGRNLCAKDDLESLGYTLIYFMHGNLPWESLGDDDDLDEKYRLVLEMKLNMSMQELCDGLPEEFARYMTYVRSCAYDQVPDYHGLKSMFRALAQREGIEYDNIYDWTYRIFLQQTLKEQQDDHKETAELPTT